MRSITARLWNNEFSRGGFFLAVGSFAGNILNYLFNTLSGRALGPIGYGELSALFSYLYITAVPLTVLTTVLIQKISATDKKLETTIAIEKYFIDKTKALWPIFVIALLLTPLVPRLTNLSNITAYSLIPLTFISFITAFYNGALQGLRLFKFFAYVGLVSAFLRLLGAALVFAGVDGLATIIIFLVISGSYSFFAFRSRIHQSKNFAGGQLPEISKKIKDIISDQQFLITTVSLLAITLLNNADIIYMKKFAPPDVAGIYSSWSLFAKIILFIMSPAISIAFVFFASTDTQRRQRQTMTISLLALLVVTIISLVGYRFAAPLLVSILFGSSYSAVVPHLFKAAIFGSFYTAIFFLNNYFLAKKSRGALIIAIAVLFYIAALFTTNAIIDRVFSLNILFCVVVTLLYLGAYWQERKKLLL